MSDRLYRPLNAWGKIAAAVAAALCATSLRAQTAPTTDSSTIIFGQRQQRDEPTIWFAPVHGNLTLRTTWTDARTSSGGNDTRISERLFEETLTLYTRGYIVHPNLVDFRLSVTGGLTQSYIDTDLGSDNSAGTIYGWDTSATILRNQPASLTLYSRRTEALLDVPFGPTQRTTSTTFGATLDYHTADTRMRLDAYHEENTQSGLSQNDPGYIETRDVVDASGESQLNENHTLTWNLSLQQATYDSGTGVTDEQSLAASVAHVYAFGPDNRHSLSSGVSYTQTTNSLDRSDFRWNEHLHLYHTPNLETNYNYSYEQLTYGGNTTDHHSAYADARHQLYKSLTTSGRVHWDDIGSGSTSIQTYGADLNLNYRKNVTGGALLADAHLGYRQQEVSGSGEIIIPVQPIVFTNLDPVEISQANVIPSTVLIRDATTGRIYTPGVDYTLTPTPQGTQIDRVLGGNILPGQPLLLSYGYDPLDASSIETTSFGTGARYQITKGPLAGLTPYARFYGQDQSISGGTARPNTIRDYALGTYYQIRDLTLKAERQWHDSTLFPYDAWKYEARLDHRFSADTSAAGSATYTDTQYHDPEQSAQSLSLNASVTQRITSRLNISLYAAYANVYTDTGETQGLEEGLEATWQHRDTKIYLRLRNSTLDTDTTERNFQFFQVGLTRRF